MWMHLAVLLMVRLPGVFFSKYTTEKTPGKRVWANPRAIVAMMRQCNTVDMTRRSPSYEVRLAKYSSRGYEVYVPGLLRGEIDPTVSTHYQEELRMFLTSFCPDF